MPAKQRKRRYSGRVDAVPPPARTAVYARVHLHDMRVLVDEWHGDPSVSLHFDSGRYGMSLTNLTVPELLVFKALVNAAIDLALPISEMLDERHRDADPESDVYDTAAFHRLYRQPPMYSLRERILAEQYTGVPGGPDVVAGVVEQYKRPGTVHVERIGGVSGPVLTGAPEDVHASDDPPQDGGDEGAG